jgi:3-hydroxypropanoate dehydrogenase
MAEVGELVEFPGGRPPAGLVGLERLLRPATDGRGFSGRPLGRDTLEELHALMAVSPGMADASPARVLFVTSPAGRTRLAPRLPARARDAAVTAPACAVVGYDAHFAEQLIAFVGDGPPGGSCFDRPATLRAAAMRNRVLQGAYLALSARALGLEVAFVHGFDGPGLADEFFRDPDMEVIFVAALGYPLEHDRHPPAADGVCAGPPKR